MRLGWVGCEGRVRVSDGLKMAIRVEIRVTMGVAVIPGCPAHTAKSHSERIRDRRAGVGSSWLDVSGATRFDVELEVERMGMDGMKWMEQWESPTRDQLGVPGVPAGADRPCKINLMGRPGLEDPERPLEAQDACPDPH